MSELTHARNNPDNELDISREEWLDRMLDDTEKRLSAVAAEKESLIDTNKALNESVRILTLAEKIMAFEIDRLRQAAEVAWDELTQAKQSPTTQDVSGCIDRARDAIAKCLT